jgi:molecular chaperone GrpE
MGKDSKQKDIDQKDIDQKDTNQKNNNTEQQEVKEEKAKAEETKAEAKAETKAESKADDATKAKAEKAEADKAKAKAEAEAEEYKRKWYAVTAEYENYRKRTKDTAAQKYNEGVADILLKIMPIGDNIDRALAVCNDEKMKQGLVMVKTSFEKVLLDEGVEAFDPTGEEFNPATSAAVMAQPAAEGEEAGIVKQTFVKGYKKGDKVLRFAQVVVTS